MPSYKAPLQDINFLLKDVFDATSHYATLDNCPEITEDVIDAIINEAAKFAEQVVGPLNAVGDAEGCQFNDGKVTTPTGFKDAYQQYVDNGWVGLGCPEEFGGQNMPPSLGSVVSEMIGGSNWAWSMYPGLSNAGIECIGAHGSEEQKQTYLHHLVKGSWTGSMCLTEPHCGSDVGLIKTKAIANADGSYSMTGTKIFISGGDHDMADNIIHMVLARVEGAPEGTKGISLFIVPKFIVNEDGTLGERNTVNAGSIEHKMGCNGSATCVMNFDGAKAFIVGEENSGLQQMFTMMNTARIGTALQGMCIGNNSYQGAVEYAKERLQMRSLSGPKNEKGPADPIIVHPDVRRMLLTQKSLIEGSRALVYWLNQENDKSQFAKTDEERETAEAILGMLTPLAKGFCTEVGNEVSAIGIQVYGGHGFIREHGMEQHARDNRISTIWEGTTGIQALDLIGRKVLGSGGELLRGVTKIIHKYCEANKDDALLAPFVESLAARNKEWGEVTMTVGAAAMENPDEVGAASVDYLMFGGYVILGYLWSKMAQISQAKIDAGDNNPLYFSKVHTAKFYFDRIMPRTNVHLQAMKTGSANLMDIQEEHFIIS
ncbi:MAG: acyl-CoA dehydrogenase C-terminal domain-containing protein [Pseudomonadota bacterium]